MGTTSQITFDTSTLLHWKVQNMLSNAQNLKSWETGAASSPSRQVSGLIREMAETLPPSLSQEKTKVMASFYEIVVFLPSKAPSQKGTMGASGLLFEANKKSYVGRKICS